jgi:radical SAM protein with 4Fe4S-binding SPASM domain
LINEIPKVGICGVELTGFYGEPTMHPNFDYFVSGLKSKGISIGLITNGDFLDKIKSYSLLSYIRVSISSLKNEVHKKIRGGKKDISKILEDLRNINYSNKVCFQPVTGLGFTIDLYNYKEVYDVCIKACHIGCNNIRLTPVWKNDMSYWTKISEEVHKQVKEAKKEIGDRLKIIGPDTYEKVYMGKKNYHRCCYSNLTMNITADGECYPCCVTRGVKGWSFGNINEQSLDEIVWGYPRRKLLKNINPNGCPSCIWDAKNEFIEYMVEGGMHAEFV